MLRLAAILGILLAGVSRAADLGPLAKYDDDSPAAIAGNDLAVEQLLASFDLQGGTLDLRSGVLHISNPIKNPTRWQPIGSTAMRPLAFAIDGKINSFLQYHGEGAAIEFAPLTPTVTPAGGWGGATNLRLRLSGFTLVGNPRSTGVKLLAGGKFTTLRDLRITACKLGLDAKAFDGGAFQDVYCYANETGAKFDTCMLNQFVRFTCRENTGDGLLVIGGGAWSGQIYLESNLGWQGDFSDLRRSNLTVWWEDHGRGPPRKLVRRRDCLWNVWSGQTHDDRLWDDDPISAAMNKALTAPASFPSIGEAVGTLTDFAAYGGGPLLTQDGKTLVAKPGCYDRPQNGNNYGELRGFDPQFNRQWKAGDYCEVTGEVVTDQATVDWSAGQSVLMLGMAGSTFPQCKQNIILSGERTPIRMMGKASADGSGLRLFVFLLGRRDQPNEVRFGFENLVVRYFANQ